MSRRRGMTKYDYHIISETRSAASSTMIEATIQHQCHSAARNDISRSEGE